MKKIIIVFLMTAFLAFSIGVGMSVSKASFGEVDSVDGVVTVLRGEETLDAVKGMELEKKDLIKTGNKASITVNFKSDITGTVLENEEITVNDLYFKSKIDALKNNIKKPGAENRPAKIETITIGGTRGTEESEKKSKDLKNEHFWDEEVE